MVGEGCSVSVVTLTCLAEERFAIDEVGVNCRILIDLEPIMAVIVEGLRESHGNVKIMPFH